MRNAPDVEKERCVSFSRVNSIFNGFPFQHYISDQFRSYQYADIRVYICAYLSRDVLHMLSSSFEVTSQRAYPVNWWKWKLRDLQYSVETPVADHEEETGKTAILETLCKRVVGG